MTENFESNYADYISPNFQNVEVVPKDTLEYIGTFLDEIIEGARFTAEKKGLLLEDEMKGDGKVGLEIVRPLAYVHVDPERLREVVTNMFDNAVKYTEEGKISIGMHVDDKEVVVVRPMLYISLTIDHRVIDAHQTNQFLTKLVSVLESWGKD